MIRRLLATCLKSVQIMARSSLIFFYIDVTLYNAQEPLDVEGYRRRIRVYGSMWRS